VPTTETPAGELDLDEVLREVADAARPTAQEGEVADYIEPLASVDPDCFGLAAVELDGTEHVLGDIDQPLPIQSISKVFTLVLAMQKVHAAEGVRNELWSRVGVEPSGDPFNSLVQLEHEKGIPRNPMINAGALVVHDVLLDHCDDPREAMLDLMATLAREDVGIDDEVMAAESEPGTRNHAIGNLMSSFGNLTHPVDEVIGNYIHACAVSMTTRQLARATRFLANDGIEPDSGERILPAALARRVSALMLTCGTYDSAGEFAFDVGLPCKSGVAGAIIASVPDRMGLCVWSPPLEDQGNSVAGHRALHELAERLELSIF
jgi:glutaminase